MYGDIFSPQISSLYARGLSKPKGNSRQGRLVPLHARKSNGRNRYIAPPVLNLNIDGDEWSIALPGRFNSRK